MPALHSAAAALLEDIESRIDPETEEDFSRQWEDFLYDRFDGEIFSPCRRAVSPPGVVLPHVNINDALADYETMLTAQMQNVSAALAGRHGNLSVRANYGTGILSSLFGAEVFEMPRSMDTLPTTRPFNDTEKMRRIAENGVPDLEGGLGRRVFEFGEYCREIFARYPKIERCVEVFHPDTQGPLDICELLWGCDLFCAMYDEPELVHAVMRVLTDTYAAFLGKWYGLYPANTRMNAHWGILRHRGAILLRDDSAMNLSPALYREYAAPYDGELLEKFGGGAVHFCGRGDHYFETLCALPGLTGINMSQPHLNDMEKIYRNTVDRGIKLLAFDSARAEADRARGFHGNLSI